MERTQGVERRDPLRDEWDAAAFGPLFFGLSSACLASGQEKTGPRAGLACCDCVASAFEMLKLV